MLEVSILYISFFFSSRRRHTRLVSDWSSDVCSSDLVLAVATPIKIWNNARIEHRLQEQENLLLAAKIESLANQIRSEERRVGKECRSRGLQNQEKKKKRRSDDILIAREYQ